MKTPATTKILSESFQDYFNRVKEVHKHGFPGTSILSGSTGWKYAFSDAEAAKNILRTHTTAVSSKYLKRLADEYKASGVVRTAKYFSIDRVFRNETIDSTHLAEFH